MDRYLQKRNIYFGREMYVNCNIVMSYGINGRWGGKKSLMSLGKVRGDEIQLKHLTLDLFSTQIDRQNTSFNSFL